MHSFKISHAVQVAFAVSAIPFVPMHASAQTFAAIDQFNNSYNGVPGTGSPPNGFNFGQSFVPSFSQIDAVEFLLRVYTLSGTGEAVSGKVVLHKGITGTDGFSGEEVATSSEQTVLPGVLQRLHFNFPSTVSLNPGETYLAEFSRTTGTGIIGYAAWDQLSYNDAGELVFGTDIYPTGRIYYRGFQLGSPGYTDAVFATGINAPVPELSSYLLLASGLLVLTRINRARNRPTSPEKWDSKMLKAN